MVRVEFVSDNEDTGTVVGKLASEVGQQEEHDAFIIGAAPDNNEPNKSGNRNSTGITALADKFGITLEPSTTRAQLINEKLLTKKNQNSDIYAGAAEYLYYQGIKLEDGIRLTEIAIQLDKNNGWARSLKIKIYEKMQQYDEALLALAEYKEYALLREWDNEVEKNNTLNYLEKEYKRIINSK